MNKSVKTQHPAPPSPAPSKFFLFRIFRLEIILTLVSLSALILSAHTYELLQAQFKILQQYTNSAAQSKNEFQQLATSLATLSESHASVQNEISQLIAKVNHAPINQDESYLTVQQAKQYLELAKIESRWQYNAPTYFMFLQQSLRLLKTPQDASLQPIIDGIEVILAQDQNNPHLALNQILKQFHSLENQILGQSGATNILNSNSANTQTIHSPILSIQHTSPNSQAPHLQEDLGINRIILNLQLAKIALIQNDSAIYQTAIEHAIEDLQSTFIGKNEIIQPLKAELVNLKNTQISPRTQELDPIITQITQWMHEHRISPSNQP